MNMAVACCCDVPLPSPCPDAVSVRLQFAGIDAAKCPCSFAIILGSNAIKVTALNVDGIFDVPHIGGGVYRDTLTPGGVMSIEYYNDQTCTDLNSTCNADDLFINYEVDCTDLNDQGQPRILNIQIRSGAGTCAPPTPEQTHNFAFWYDSTACGGTYYHGDAVPNGGPLGASCDRTDPAACLPSAGYLSTGGTVQAIP